MPGSASIGALEQTAGAHGVHVRRVAGIHSYRVSRTGEAGVELEPAPRSVRGPEHEYSVKAPLQSVPGGWEVPGHSGPGNIGIS